MEELKSIVTMDVNPDTHPSYVVDLMPRLTAKQHSDMGLTTGSFDVITLEYPPTTLYISKEGVIYPSFFENVAELLADGGIFLMPCAMSRRYHDVFCNNIENAVPTLKRVRRGRGRIFVFIKQES